MEIRKSAEDYLEAILRLRQERGYVHSIDVVRKLGFSKPSVSIAMAKLREGGYITMEESGELHLTEAGEQVAQRVFERHRVLMAMLLHCGVPADVAERDACEIEHVISAESFEKIQEHFSEHLEQDAAMPVPNAGV